MKRIKNLFSFLLFAFITGGLIGVAAEGMWCAAVKGEWETHVTLLWSPLNVLYGVGAVIICLVSMLLKEYGYFVKFFAFACAGTVLEYLTGWFQETVFNSVSWDYSGMSLSFAGKISLIFSIIWGLLGTLFSIFILPVITKAVEKTNRRVLSALSIVLSVFLAADMIFSTAVLIRWGERSVSSPDNIIEIYIDEKYPDEYLQKRFCEWKHIN